MLFKIGVEKNHYSNNYFLSFKLGICEICNPRVSKLNSRSRVFSLDPRIFPKVNMKNTVKSL